MSIAQTTDRQTGAANEVAIEAVGAPQRKSRKLSTVRLISIVGVLIAWEVFGRLINPLFMSYPSAIAVSAARMLSNGELLVALSSSLQSFVIGIALASVIGITIGFLTARFRYVDAAMDWMINALYATPHIAVIPLIILWLGLGAEAKIFIVTITAVFPMLVNTASGVRNVPPGLIEVGKSFGASERQIFTKIILHSALPYIVTGFRLGLGRGIIGMVVAEFFTAITGLGALIVKYGNQYDTASMFVPIFVLMAMGVGLTALVKRAELIIAPWKASQD